VLQQARASGGSTEARQLASDYAFLVEGVAHHRVRAALWRTLRAQRGGGCALHAADCWPGAQWRQQWRCVGGCRAMQARPLPPPPDPAPAPPARAQALLEEYNIGLDQEEREKRMVTATASRVGFALPTEPKPSVEALRRWAAPPGLAPGGCAAPAPPSPPGLARHPGRRTLPAGHGRHEPAGRACCAAGSERSTGGCTASATRSTPCSRAQRPAASRRPGRKQGSQQTVKAGDTTGRGAPCCAPPPPPAPTCAAATCGSSESGSCQSRCPSARTGRPSG